MASIRQMVQRGGDETVWANSTKIPKEYEIIIRKKTGGGYDVCVGDGVTAGKDLDPISAGSGGGGGGSGVPDDTGPKTFLYNSDTTPSQPVRVDGPSFASALGLALQSSDDDAVTTLSSVGNDLANHEAIGVTDFTQSVHGLWPTAVLQANLLNGRYRLYQAPSVTTPPSGNAGTGIVELLGINTGTFKGLWYRDDSHPYEKIAPGESFTPYFTGPVLGAGSAASTWTPASGSEEIFGASRNRVAVRCSEADTTKRYSQIEVSCNRVTTAGVAGLKLRAAYYDGTTLQEISGAEIPLDATGTKISAAIDLPSGVYTRETAVGNSEFALKTVGGNGTTPVSLVGAYILLR